MLFCGSVKNSYKNLVTLFTFRRVAKHLYLLKKPVGAAEKSEKNWPLHNAMAAPVMPSDTKPQ